MSQRINLGYAWNDSPNSDIYTFLLLKRRAAPLRPPREILVRCCHQQHNPAPHHTNDMHVTKSPTATSTNDIHKITKIPRLHCKLPPNHSLALSHPACIVCIVDVRERGIAPFLASVTDNGFKSVCQMKWVYSITQPHSDVNRTHPHPHHTPLVNGLQHLCARN